MSSISIVIATYNRASLLDECLSHLSRQHFDDGDEVVVVDNGSSDATPAVLARHARTFPVPLRALAEARPGKSHALTEGLGAATGDIVAFTDDDVNVSSEWLSVIRAGFRNPGVALVGGPVAPRWERPAPRWLARGADEHTRFNAPLALLDYGPKPTSLGERTFLGANMAIRRTTLEDVGGFANHLGKVRGTLLSGEDHDLCQRVQAAGHGTLYVPAAIVYHWVPASRMRLAYFLSWFYWSGITHARLEASQGASGLPSPVLPRYLARRAVLAVGSSILAAARGQFTRAVDAALDVAFATGYASAYWRRAALDSQGEATS